MRARATAVAFAIAAICYALMATSASALEPGVFVAPGSPAGREYALPLPTARGQAVGRPVNPSGTEPLFGVGISPPAAGRGSSGAANTTTGANGSRHQSRGHARHSAANSPAVPGANAKNHVSRQELASLTHQGSAVPQVALWGGLVLLGGLVIGGLLAFLARRRSP